MKKNILIIGATGEGEEFLLGKGCKVRSIKHQASSFDAQCINHIFSTLKTSINLLYIKLLKESVAC
jgi:hypothetical protein